MVKNRNFAVLQQQKNLQNRLETRLVFNSRRDDRSPLHHTTGVIHTGF